MTDLRDRIAKQVHFDAKQDAEDQIEGLVLHQSAQDPRCMHRANANHSYRTTKRVQSLVYDTLLKWRTKPSKVLLFKKINDATVTNDLITVANWLIKAYKNIRVYVEPGTYTEVKKMDNKLFSKLQAKEMSNPGSEIDFIIVLGGDGTLLYLISLFQGRKTVPPIACFQRGSLGFLAPFDINKYKPIIQKMMNEKIPHAICVRMRITARLWKHRKNVTDEQLANARQKSLRRKHSMRSVLDSSLSNLATSPLTNFNKCPSVETVFPNSKHRRSNSATHPIKLTQQESGNFDIIDDSDVAFVNTLHVFPGHVCLGDIYHALNEVLVHRQNDASMMQADLYLDGTYCTTIQADGMIFSTPTGSTAYNISAGGSLISPTVPCIALTPICPHTLSFRPVVVPDSTIIHLKVPETSRSGALLSLDGRKPVVMDKGDVVEIIKCPYPVPTFKSEQFNVEWFRSLVDKFNWNVRELQKSHDPAVFVNVDADDVDFPNSDNSDQGESEGDKNTEK